MSSRAIRHGLLTTALGLAFASTAACVFDFDRFGASSDAPPLDAPDAGTSADADTDASAPADEQDAGVDAAQDASTDANLGPCDEPDLVARWRLDEGSGAVVHDCTAGATHGKITGNGMPKWVPGHAGTALDLHPSFVSFGDAAKVKLTGALTVTAWVKIREFPGPSSSAYVVGKTNNILTGGWRLAVEQQSLSFAVARGSNWEGCEATKSYSSLNTWVHVAGVYTPGAHVKIYVDGVAGGSCATQVPAEILETSCDLRMGLRGDDTPDTAYKGVVDDVRIYSRALTAAEVLAIAKAP